MDTLSLMSGIDIPLPSLGAAIHQPTITEISFIGELQYFQTIQLLCFNKDTIIAANPQVTSSLTTMNNFQIFMELVGKVDDKHSVIKQNDLLSVLTVLFPHHQAQFLPNGIFFHNDQDNSNFTLDERNFDTLREILYSISGLGNTTGGQNAGFNPKNKKAADIAAKLMRGRAKAAKSNGSGTGEGVLSRYVSVLTVGLGAMTLKDCLNLTVYQLYDLIERYGLYIGWDLDVRSRLAGGKPDSKPDDWMKDIH